MTAFSQPGIFNVLDYYMSPMASGEANAMALQAAINDAQNSHNPNGAIVLIPSFDDASPPNYGPYQIAVPSGWTAAVTIPSSSTYSNSPLLICGTGIGTTLQMSTEGGTLFEVDSSSYVTFQDLTVEYLISEGVGGVGIAFEFETAGSGTSEGYKLFRVNIVNCQTAVKYHNLVTGTDMLQCNVTYDSSYPVSMATAPTGVVVSGTQAIIDQCTFSCLNDNPYATGIAVFDSSDPRVTNTKISGFYTGLLVSGTGSVAQNGSFSGLVIDATDTCIKIGNNVFDVDVTNCTCTPTPGSTPSDAGIIIDGDSSGSLDTVRVTACNVYGYPTYGIEIGIAQNVQINGGHYSGNGTAGIAITGASTEIQIEGVDCVGPSYAGSSTITTVQQYGITITSGTDIQLIGVNCSGNGTSSESPNGIGIRVAGATDVRIVGATCNGPVFGSSASITQEYGISVTAATGVVVDGCSLIGNTQYGIYLDQVSDVTVTSCDLYYDSAVPSVGGVYLTGSVLGSTNVFLRGCNMQGFGSYTDAFHAVTVLTLSNVQVTNCAGYNDQTVRLSITSPGVGVTFSGLTYSYFGPTAFYIVTTGTVQVDGYSTSIGTGSYTLNPGENAEVPSGTISSFLMIGK